MQILFENKDAKIELLVGYKKLNTVVSLSNLATKMNCRIKFCDFVNVFPGFSRIDFSFNSSPLFDFDISTGCFKLTEIPGFSRWMQYFLKTEMFSGVIFPKKASLLLVNEDVEEKRVIGGLIMHGQQVSHSEGMLRVNFAYILIIYLL
ncbi:hypothetical protein MHBO_000251 [Bonamia ostreae]|uniref:Uncharacterized protein n=1 Tax=Bonamia ostreae TaxID=126728 RepID=A0ABV2AF38_9EUKA